LAYGLSGKPELDRLFKEAKMQEPIGPFYCDDAGGPIISYPLFIRGDVRDMTYFTGPMKRTLYYVQGCDEIKQSTVVGRIVPEEELPSELQLSQLSQDFSEEEPEEVQGFLESTHAYTLLYPTFKKIICLATGDRKLASLSYDSLKILHKTLLTKLAPAPNSEHTTLENVFRSSNLELDFNAKSNKRIRPRGESDNRKKKKNKN
jgi:hypothetical protein